jgi:hypothetical protein
LFKSCIVYLLKTGEFQYFNISFTLGIGFEVLPPGLLFNSEDGRDMFFPEMVTGFQWKTWCHIPEDIPSSIT